MSNYYKILGVGRNATDKEIRRAYYKIARELHPDKAEWADKQLENEQKLAVVSEAYNTLKDPVRRQEYDKSIAAGTDTGKNPHVGNTASPAAAGEKVEVNEQRAGIAKRAFQQGLLMFKQKEYARSIEFFEAAIKNDHGVAEYHSHLAHASLLAKRGFTKAIECCQEAIRLDPYNVDHKIIMARIYETVGSFSNAERMYQEVLRLDPQNTTAARRLEAIRHDANKIHFLPLFLVFILLLILIMLAQRFLGA